jgi:hypothetical protein
MTADDPRSWHPEMAEPRDLTVAAQFGAMLIGGVLSDGPPSPGSRLARFNTVCDAFEAGQVTREELDRFARALMQEVIDEVEAEELGDGGADVTE